MKTKLAAASLWSMTSRPWYVIDCGIAGIKHDMKFNQMLDYDNHTLNCMNAMQGSPSKLQEGDKEIQSDARL